MRRQKPQSKSNDADDIDQWSATLSLAAQTYYWTELIKYLAYHGITPPDGLHAPNISASI